MTVHDTCNMYENTSGGDPKAPFHCFPNDLERSGR